MGVCTEDGQRSEDRHLFKRVSPTYFIRRALRVVFPIQRLRVLNCSISVTYGKAFASDRGRRTTFHTTDGTGTIIA